MTSHVHGSNVSTGCFKSRLGRHDSTAPTLTEVPEVGEKRTLVFKYIRRRRDGSYYMDNRLVAMHGHGKNAILFLALSRNLSPKMRAELAQKIYEQRTKDEKADDGKIGEKQPLRLKARCKVLGQQSAPVGRGGREYYFRVRILDIHK